MSFSYSICSRETKKGTVYDARFRVVDGRGSERQKKALRLQDKRRSEEGGGQVPVHLCPGSTARTDARSCRQNAFREGTCRLSRL